MNVTEEITPFEKQDHEFKDFHLCEGGHIQYVRLDNPENTDAVKAVIPVSYTHLTLPTSDLV